MTARALQTINSGFGTFVRRDPIRGVPDDVVEAWVAAGIAAHDPTPAAEPEADAAPDLDAMKKPALVALAESLGLDASGKVDELRDRIREAQAAEPEPATGEPESDADPDA